MIHDLWTIYINTRNPYAATNYRTDPVKHHYHWKLSRYGDGSGKKQVDKGSTQLILGIL
jgi:hypothetical protein